MLIEPRKEQDTIATRILSRARDYGLANQKGPIFDRIFNRDEKVIRKHINNVFNDGELDRENNTQKVRVDGVKQPVSYYNLDVVISVGYRVKSLEGVRFRKWATERIKEYCKAGCAGF